MPLFVLLLVPLIFLIAFIVDMGVFFSHDDEWQRDSDAAAVAALGVYLDELRLSVDPSKPTPVELKNAADRATNRARHLLEANPLFAQGFMKDPSLAPTTVNLSSNAGFGNLELGLFCGRDDVGVVTGCAQAGFNAQPWDTTTPGLLPNNSVKLTLRMQPGTNVLNTFFAKVMGIEEQTFQVESVSVFSPVSIMVLLDSSRSVWEFTHRPFGINYSKPFRWQSSASTVNPQGNPIGDCDPGYHASAVGRALKSSCGLRGTRSDAAYKVKSAVGCAYEFERGDNLCARAAGMGYNCDSPCASVVDPSGSAASPPPARCTIASPIEGQTATGIDHRDAAEWASFPDTLPSGYTLPADAGTELVRPFQEIADPLYGSATPGPDDGFDGIRHPRDHYFCRTFPNGDSYLVDYNTDNAHDVTDFQGNWEPWNSLRAGVVAVMDEIEERLSVHDRFGALAFDNLPLNPNRGLALSSPSAAAFATFKVGIGEDPLLWLPGNEPIAYGWVPYFNAYTDLVWRTAEAVWMLAAETTHPYAEMSILAYSDGLANCIFDGLGNRVCDTSGEYVIRSLHQELPLLAEYLAMNEISFSFAGAGPRFRELLYRSELATGCMGFPEMTELGRDPFNSNWASRYDPGSVANWIANANADFYADYTFEPDPSSHNSWPDPFYAPLEIYYRIVKPTNGVFKAIPPCLRNSSGDCIGFCTELTAYCNSTGAPGDLLPGAVIDIPGLGMTPVTDAQGRVLYNCDGVDMKDGIKDALKSLINLRVFNTLSNPYPYLTPPPSPVPSP